MNDTLLQSCKEMHNSIGIITWEKLCLINYHRLNHFPYKKETFPTFDVVALPGQNHLSSARATVIDRRKTELSVATGTINQRMQSKHSCSNGL